MTGGCAVSAVSIIDALGEELYAREQAVGATMTLEDMVELARQLPTDREGAEPPSNPDKPSSDIPTRRSSPLTWGFGDTRLKVSAAVAFRDLRA